MSSDHIRRKEDGGGDRQKPGDAQPVFRSTHSNQRAGSVAQIHRSLKAWRSHTDGEDAKDAEGAKAEGAKAEGAKAEATKPEGAKDEGAEPAEDTEKESLSVSAKLKNLSRKVYRAGNPQTPIERGRAILAQNGNSIGGSMAALNQLGLSDADLVTLVTEAYRNSGRDTAGTQATSQGIVVLSRRLGPNQEVLIIQGGKITKGYAELYADGMNVKCRNVTK